MGYNFQRPSMEEHNRFLFTLPYMLKNIGPEFATSFTVRRKSSFCFPFNKKRWIDFYDFFFCAMDDRDKNIFIRLIVFFPLSLSRSFSLENWYIFNWHGYILMMTIMMIAGSQDNIFFFCCWCCCWMLKL